MRKSYVQHMINWSWYMVVEEKEAGVEVISYDRHHRFEDRGCKVPFKIDGTLHIVSEGANRTLTGITVNDGSGLKTYKVLNSKHIFSYQ